MVATMTFGAIAAYVGIVVVLLGCLVVLVLALMEGELGVAACCLVVAVVAPALFWWGMAFTTSSDYHAWNEKQGFVSQVAKRQIATDSGMSERYVLKVNGRPYGVDDTRAALVKIGDEVSLLCKKDYQWGVPRGAQGWVCRWNGTEA